MLNCIRIRWRCPCCAASGVRRVSNSATIRRRGGHAAELVAGMALLELLLLLQRHAKHAAHALPHARDQAHHCASRYAKSLESWCQASRHRRQRGKGLDPSAHRMPVAMRAGCRSKKGRKGRGSGGGGVGRNKGGGGGGGGTSAAGAAAGVFRPRLLAIRPTRKSGELMARA